MLAFLREVIFLIITIKELLSDSLRVLGIFLFMGDIYIKILLYLPHIIKV